MIRQVRGEWEQICLDTTPADRAVVQEILGRLYAVAGYPAPKQIIYSGSPLQVLSAAVDSRLEGCQDSAKNLTEIRYEAFQRVLGFLRHRFRDHSRPAVAFHVRAQVREQVCNQFRNSFGDQCFASFIETAEHQFVKNVRAKFSPHAAFIQSNGEAYSQVIDHIRGHILDQIFDQVDDQIRELAHAHFVLKYDGGVISQDLMNFRWGIDPWISWHDFFSRLGVDASILKPSLELAKACGWYILTENQAYISAKPECIHLDDRGRLHCETGAAIRYPDGFSVFAIHGVRVPEKVAVSPESIMVGEIESEQNAEVRRVMIERYGLERFLVDSGAEEVHRDDFGVLYRKKLPGDEDLVMVKVVNSTLEPDGSFKDYFLRVPPILTQARHAVAWTFGKEENEYSPAFQT